LARPEAVGRGGWIRMETPQALAKAAVSLASMISADAVIVSYSLVDGREEVLKEFSPVKKVIVCSEGEEKVRLYSAEYPVVQIPLRYENGETKIEQVIGVCVRRGLLVRGEKVICIDGGNAECFSIHVKVIDGIEKIFSLCEPVEHAIKLALQIANQTYNGMRIGAAFVIGDTKKVLRYSHQLERDPLASSPAICRDIKRSENFQEIVKIAAKHDGAFVVDSNGIIQACCRHLDANRKVNLQGLGSRHYAVAAMTLATKAIGVVISQEDGNIRVFQNGKIIMRILPSGKVIETSI
jgi:DNA integrity scanning protein DisA with diadenylate cyclase activity